MSYGQLRNPSKKYTMTATLRIPGERERIHKIPPEDLLVTVGLVNYPLWTLEWKQPRVGLMRFSR